MKSARYRHQGRHSNRTPSVILLGPPRPPVTLPRDADAEAERPALALEPKPEPLAEPRRPETAREPKPPQRLSKRQARRAAARAARKQHKAALRGRPVPLPDALRSEPVVPPVEQPVVAREPAPVEPKVEAPVVQAEPTVAEEEAARTPLPRTRALAIHRPRGPLAVIAFWTRSAVRSMAPRRDPKASAAEHLSALRSQVEVLQESIDRLEKRLAA